MDIGHTQGVYAGQIISAYQAEQLLLDDLEETEKAVESLVKVHISNNQFSALVSFAYNVGINAFKNSSLLRFLNFKEYEKASNEFLKWNKGGGKALSGLTIRRKKEKALFDKIADSEYSVNYDEIPKTQPQRALKLLDCIFSSIQEIGNK